MRILNKLAFSLIFAAIVFTTLAYGAVHQPIIAVFYLLVAVMVLIWAADCFAGGAVRVDTSKLQVPLLLLGIYGLVQVIPFGTVSDTAGVLAIPRTISLEPFATEITSVHILFLCCFLAIVLVYIDTASRVRKITTLLLVFGFVYAFYAILQSALSPDKIYGIYAPANGTPFGSFVNRHDFAAIMEMSLGVPLGLMFAGAVRRDKKLLYIVGIALMGAALLLSRSRGGLVAFFAELILIVILTTRARGTRNVILKIGLSLLFIAAAVGGAIFVGGETSLTRFAESAATQNISSNRTHIWSVTVEMIRSNMPFGVGLGAYPQAYTSFDTLSGSDRVEQAHNDYLQVPADAGIMGLIIGALFLFWFVREGIRNTHESNTFRRGVAVGAFAGCCAILVHSIFDFVLHITAVSVMFLTLMSMLVASGRKYKDDTDEFDEPRKKRRRSASVSSIDTKADSLISR